MKQGLYVQWYDLASDQVQDYLAWLHGDHLPHLQKSFKVNWIGHYRIVKKSSLKIEGTAQSRRETSETVPIGSQYVLLISAPLETLISMKDEPLMLAAESQREKRQHFRDAIFLEEVRVNGPAHHSDLRDRSAPAAMQLGNFNIVSPEAEQDMARYYRHHRFLQVEKTQGCYGARKYVSIFGWPKHGILYEFEDMRPDESLFEARMNMSSPHLKWTGPHPLNLVIHAPNAPHAGRRLWPPTNSEVN